MVLIQKLSIKWKTFLKIIDEFVPHVLICEYEEEGGFEESLRLIRSKLPETHIVLLANELNWIRALELYDKGVYDCVEFPLLDERALVQSVDRAIERDCSAIEENSFKELFEQGEGSNIASHPMKALLKRVLLLVRIDCSQRIWVG